MRTPAEIRSDAMECLRLAGEANAADDRQVLLILAQGWALLAQQAEQRQALRDGENVVPMPSLN